MRGRGLAISATLLIMLCLLLIPFLKREIAIHSFEKNAPGARYIEQVSRYDRLLEQVGAVRGQEVLLATMSTDSATHVLNHESGKYLYKTEGFAGVAKCTTDFADSCYHGFISAYVNDQGLTDLHKLLAACTDGVVRDQTLQCAHGIGHGFLEYVGYKELPHALDLCKQTFGTDLKASEHCYEGVFMENNFGDFNTHATPADRWTKADNPMYPCNEPQVLALDGAHKYCWFMQSQTTLRIGQYPSLGGDVKKIASYCETLKNDFDQSTCFMGLGRQVQVNNRNDSAKSEAICNELGGPEAKQCIWYGLEAAYIYGQRGTQGFDRCDKEPSLEDADSCYHTLFVAMAISYTAGPNRDTACSTLRDPKRQNECTAWMHTSEAAQI